jgi:hypothetical protein
MSSAQETRLLSFLAQHFVSPVDWAPVKSAAAPAMPWTARFLPNRGPGFSMRRDWRRGGARFLESMAASWRSRGLLDGAYFYAWDEPGRRAERKLRAIDELVHQHAPGVKTFATTFPRERKPARRVCASFGHVHCGLVRGSRRSNSALWDGGPDDVDAWAIPTERYYGQWTSPLERRVGVDHSRDTWHLIQRLRKAGKEIWSYSYYMPTSRLPQLIIDGPGTDPTLLMLWNAYEDNAGWLTWQAMRWIAPRGNDWGRPPLRNPYENTISSVNPAGNVGNGDVSLFYPPVAPQYGLTDPLGDPVTSLRFESMRDGVEEANLVSLYRSQSGDAAAQRALRPLFGRVAQPSSRIGWTWTRYRRGGLALRMESVRRSLIERLER